MRHCYYGGGSWNNKYNIFLFKKSAHYCNTNIIFFFAQNLKRSRGSISHISRGYAPHDEANFFVFFFFLHRVVKCPNTTLAKHYGENHKNKRSKYRMMNIWTDRTSVTEWISERWKQNVSYTVFQNNLVRCEQNTHEIVDFCSYFQLDMDIFFGFFKLKKKSWVCVWFFISFFRWTCVNPVWVLIALVTISKLYSVQMSIFFLSNGFTI